MRSCLGFFSTFAITGAGDALLQHAFSGRATYDDFSNIGQDISDILLLISPRETPFLDALPTPARPAISTQHSWREVALGPDRLIASVAINSATAATGIQINGTGNYLQVGMLLEIDALGNQEVLQITSVVGANSILVNRQIGGSLVNSLPAGGNIFVIATAEPEGGTLTQNDVSRPRTQRDNWTQIFKKPITVSNTARSVLYLPDTGDEFAYQTTLRAIELARDLEKAVLRGVATNSIGSSTTTRTMGGLRSFITNINSTVTSTSFSADPLLYINDGMQNAWNAGARDLDILLAGDQWKRAISGTNAAKFLVAQSDGNVTRYVDTVTTDFGELRVILTPWLPSYHIMGVASRRIFPIPLRGRSFQREDLAKTGDASLAHVVGEYTLEVHHPQAMFQAHGV